MRVRPLLALALVLAVAAPAAAQTSLDAMLKPYLASHGLPALAVGVAKGGTVVAAGAAGTRRVGAVLPVSTTDRFHIGSDTKAFTALLAAMLVEDNRLRWTSTVAEVFPELTTLDARLRRATLEQLLAHTSGLPADNQAFADLLARTDTQQGNLDDLRYFMVKHVGPLPPGAEPGAAFAYSNMGYITAGAMLERAGGRTWEEMVNDRIIGPLRLGSAGFGAQATVGRVDAPLGHALVDGKLKAFLGGPDGDNPEVLGPAGTMHMSVLDFARWAGWNAGEGRRRPRLVAPETLRKLHTPVIGMPDRPDAPPGTPSRGLYALGWSVLSFPWAPEPLLFHGGSNGKNLAHIYVQPSRDYGMVLATNVTGPKADQALFALAETLYRRYAR